MRLWLWVAFFVVSWLFDVSSFPHTPYIMLSLAGLLGVAVSGVDGLEVNLLGLNFGVGPSGLKLPLLGRVGLPTGD